MGSRPTRPRALTEPAIRHTSGTPTTSPPTPRSTFAACLRATRSGTHWFCITVAGILISTDCMLRDTVLAGGKLGRRAPLPRRLRMRTYLDHSAIETDLGRSTRRRLASRTHDEAKTTSLAS